RAGIPAMIAGIEEFGHFAQQQGGEKHQGLGKNNRHDAAVIDSEREVLPLAAVDAPASGVLGLLNGNSPLRLGDEDRSGNDEHESRHEEENFSGSNFAFAAAADGHVALIDELADRAGHSSDDAGENDQADAVAQAIFVDLLAEPHEEYAAGGEGNEAGKRKCIGAGE